MEPEMLTSVEREVLVDLLIHGDNGPKNIADNIERHNTSVSRDLAELAEEDLVVNKGRGVWSLEPDGVQFARSIKRHY
jgi:predicted transcriptional regulator